ncbi:uncharacterized protein LOC124450528 [Xenia sp. Carnegie-2017]|uniref:uncharacterized protein LOC124450528 n=1 Tax=Xenia sp. Carnegie-2017 TaxID=2897299 RepID=UPI001F043950|nr:uncharacterized protein LOC124450528 [Xenia sp. Carnegie-2017]
MTKLPSDIRLQIARKSSGDVWKIDELLDTIKTEIEARELSEGVQSSPQPQHGKSSGGQHETPRIPTVNAFSTQNTSATGDDMAFFFKSENEVDIFMLGKLIVDHGGEALRITLRKQMSGTELFFFLNTTKNRNKLLRIKKKIIRHDAWILLYPDPPRLPDENDFDITLLCVLLRTICNLKQPNNPIWTNKPNATDHSTEADITRIRLYRNECYAHIPNTSFSLGDFETLWKEICQPIVRLGISQQKIDQLNQERTQSIKRIIRGSVRKGSAGFVFGTDILTKNLVSCTFESDISNQYKTFLHGTREWVFDEFLAWFEDNTSQNRAFVISAVAGMAQQQSLQ